MAIAAPDSTSRRPLGVKLVQHVVKKELSFQFYQASVLVITFVAYTLYHLSRKPTSIVKSTLVSTGLYLKPLSSKKLKALQLETISQNASQLGVVGGWAPFDGDSGTGLLGDIDVAFLAVYALGTFFAGHLGDRICLRWFLAVGMVGSGLFACLFGFAYWWNVHWLPYFFIVQMLSGLFQATGWPSVVTVVANWFGKKKRGLIMGVWNSHTSIGNICGSLIASSLLDQGWGRAFLVPGIAVAAGGVLIFFFLVVDPSIVGLPSPHCTDLDVVGPPSPHCTDLDIGQSERDHYMIVDEEAGLCKKGYTAFAAGNEGQSERAGKLKEDDNTVPLLVNHEVDGCEVVRAVGFLEALAIPGLIPFALCLFFAKLVAYTFIYWLPFYISNTEIDGEYLSDETAGNLSTLFDVGGVMGGVLAGHMSDKLNARATTAALFTYGAIPAMAMYRAYGGTSLWLNVGLLVVVGVFVNGPYSLITTAVSADLGTHERVQGNARALATVTAIIDGTGSLGAAMGPLITGYVSHGMGWNAVFGMLTISAFVSGFLLTKQVALELKSRARRR